MTITIDRRVGTLYADEKADMVLYLNGAPSEMNELWAALRDERSWDVFIGTDGRIVLKPINEKNGRRAAPVVSNDFTKTSKKEGDEER